MAADTRQLGSTRILYDPEILPAPVENLLVPEYWEARGATGECFAGRGQARAVETPGGPGVLKRYLRGGLVARVNRERYGFAGHERSRAFREWRLLQSLRQQGLPVPRPMAASCERRGLWYSAGLLTGRIPEARPLADHLAKDLADGPPGRKEWRQIGKVLRAFHDAGVEHADLNARNILLDARGGVFLVDFDKGRQVGPDTVWRQRMLRRLERSLEKFAGPDLQQQWNWLMAGYLGHSRSADKAGGKA